MINNTVSFTCFFVGAFVLTVSPVSASGAVADDDALLASSRRDLQEDTFPFGYIEPAWFDSIAEGFSGVNLKRCVKRNPNGPRSLPTTGEACSATPKTCFFGLKTCSDAGPYPEAKCFCDGKDASQTWTCEQEFCPECPPQGQGFEVFNNPLCPATSTGVGGSCSAEQNEVNCVYGREDCCGRCNPSQSWTCGRDSPESETFQWFGFFTDACLLGPQACCPSFESRNTALCFDQGAECVYNYPSSLPGAICQSVETCTCGFPGTLSYTCEQTEISCVTDDPPSFP